MKRFKSILLISLISLILSSCGSSSESKTNKNSIPDKPVLSTTVLPVATLLEKVAGGDFYVNAMVPDGMPPVAFEPTSSQLTMLENSSLYFSLEALGFELHVLPKIVNGNENIKIIDLSRGIETIIDGHDHGHNHGIDPHMWMSPKQAIQISKNIYVALIKAFPEHKEIFNTNFQALIKEIREADEYLTKNIQGEKSFMIYHPALTYLARDYGLEQIPIELHGKEPSPDYLKTVIDIAKEKNIELIFIQRQFDSNFAHIVAKETESTVIVFDPLSSDWKGTIYQVADAFKN